ncbi:GIY-YIG nuclease family protein [Sphingomonas immobilis]|uniref:GIY-YIG nuclease family protein n=1 Tax=Sphingomonas immobilis TaxID=3063997 RepID=A0ABT9A292_9SPHN|nr:GIY-YIG nuclease family protein [Sphingomonas sp. CA1-15]MDO7843557.1 GIY-YIG nuclease family protein [Sphingomonas sp. CA1-15]
MSIAGIVEHGGAVTIGNTWINWRRSQIIEINSQNTPAPRSWGPRYTTQIQRSSVECPGAAYNREHVAETPIPRCIHRMTMNAPRSEAPSSEPRRRNPDWTRDETILLMDLYLSAPRASKAHPEVAALSALLRAAARRTGLVVLASFRNPAGIAMRLRNFGRHDPHAPPSRDSGLRPGGAIDAEIWAAFGGNNAALAAEVNRIRRGLRAEDWLPHQRSSRGPAPVIGTRRTVFADGPTSVYLLLIDGPISVLAPNMLPVDGASLVKIGRTNDLDRRLSELASGLPRRAAIHYIPIGVRNFKSGADAHSFERTLLDQCDQRGWSLGGEFAYAPLKIVKKMLLGKS